MCDLIGSTSFQQLNLFPVLFQEKERYLCWRLQGGWEFGLVKGSRVFCMCELLLAWECQLHTSLARRSWYVGKLMFWALLDLFCAKGLQTTRWSKKSTTHTCVQSHLSQFWTTMQENKIGCAAVHTILYDSDIYWIKLHNEALPPITESCVYTLCGCMKLKNIQVVSQIMQIIKHAQYYNIQHCIYSENVLCSGNIVWVFFWTCSCKLSVIYFSKSVKLTLGRECSATSNIPVLLKVIPSVS